MQPPKNYEDLTCGECGYFLRLDKPTGWGYCRHEPHGLIAMGTKACPAIVFKEPEPKIKVAMVRPFDKDELYKSEYESVGEPQDADDKTTT